VGYIHNCATKAVCKAQFLGEKVAIVHHSTFLRLVEECGHPELIEELLLAAVTPRVYVAPQVRGVYHTGREGETL
jgi:hypothetical protein